jgi:hypothetical protein
VCAPPNSSGERTSEIALRYLCADSRANSRSTLPYKIEVCVGDDGG